MTKGGEKMACPYYSFKDDSHFGGEYYCTKCQDYTNDDLYYAYCKNYSYDECPLYRGQVNSVEGAKRYRAGSSGGSSSSGSASNSGGTDSYSQNTYSGGSGSRGGSIPTPSVSMGNGEGWMWLVKIVLVLVAACFVAAVLSMVFILPFGIWYMILVSEPQILAVVATIGIMAFAVWQKQNNKIFIFLEIYGVSFFSMCISWIIQGGALEEAVGLFIIWILFTLPNFLMVWAIRYRMGKDPEISPKLKKTFIILCVAYVIGLIIGVVTPFGREVIMSAEDFADSSINTQYNNNQNGNSGNYSSGDNNVGSDNDVDTNNIVGDTDVNDYDNNSNDDYSSYDGNEYDDSGYGSYDYYNGDENNSDSSDTDTGVWDNSTTYQEELDMIRNEYLLSLDEEDQVSFYYTWSDGLLNDLYQDIKSNLPSSDFETLKEDEKEWIAQKESEAEAAGNNSSNYSLAYQLSVTESTIERCQYLIDKYQGYYSDTITSNLP